MFKVLTVLGTRPEAVKLAPVILELQKYPQEIQSIVCVTAQHREMLDQVLDIFGIVPDIDLNLMQPGQSLSGITARVLTGIESVLLKVRPDLIIIQGDTTTVMAVALAAFYHQIPVGHVEAGLRSHNRFSPFPEEVNRRVASLLGTYHFAPTKTAFQALLNERVAEDTVYVTGNTVIDALHMITGRPQPAAVDALFTQIGLHDEEEERRLILVTAHRRENFGEPFESICHGLKTLVRRNPDVVIVYPVHLNPQIQEPAQRLLGNEQRIYLIEPVEYDVMAHLMKASYLVLTDSGGIQEEAPSLGKPVLVMRTETERPEAIEAGTAKLVGPYSDRIIEETERLLRDKQAYKQMAQAVSPYGDGQAAHRIVDICRIIFA